MMDLLIDDTARIEGYLGVSAPVAAEVGRHLRAAQAWLVDRMGEAWYAARLAEGAAEPMRLVAEEAEARLGLCYALDALNLRIDADGGLVQAEASTTQAAQTRYYGHRAIRACRAALRREVYRLLDLSVPVIEATAVDGGQTAVRVGAEASELRLSAVVEEAPEA